MIGNASLRYVWLWLGVCVGAWGMYDVVMSWGVRVQDQWKISTALLPSDGKQPTTSGS